jgi:PEGA domain.
MNEAHQWAVGHDDSAIAGTETPQYKDYKISSGYDQYLAPATCNITVTIDKPTGYNYPGSIKVTWSCPIEVTGNVKIELLNDNAPGEIQAIITSSIAGSSGATGKTYTIPSKLPYGPGSGYFVRISSINSPVPGYGVSTSFPILGISKSGTGKLVINSIPSGADIYLNFVKNAANTNATLTLPAEPYWLYVGKTGYNPSTPVLVTVLAGGTLTKTFTLTSSATAGGIGLNLMSTPEQQAGIIIDGIDTGDSTDVVKTVDSEDLPLIIRIEKPGYYSVPWTMASTETLEHTLN